MKRPTALLLLKGVLVVVGGYSLAMLAAGGLVQEMFEVLGFGADGAGIRDGDPRDYVLLLQGVLGAVIFGWVVLMLAVVTHGLQRDPAGPWWSALVGSVASWFVLDTGFSLVVGSWQHAVFNLVFLLGLAVPLTVLRPVQVDSPPA